MVRDEFLHPLYLAFVLGHGLVIHAILKEVLLAVMNLSAVLQLEGAQGFQGPQQDLLDVVILLQDGQGDSGTFQRGQTDVGGLCADHILTGQSPIELDLFRQVEQAVFEEHVFGLAPGAVYDDHIMFHSA